MACIGLIDWVCVEHSLYLSFTHFSLLCVGIWKQRMPLVMIAKPVAVPRMDHVAAVAA
jgi:hypothetical protein